MFVSVVVCTHSLDHYQNLSDAVQSLLDQTHRNLEIIIVVDGNRELHEKIVNAYGARSDVRITQTRESVGLSGARNSVLSRAQGDIIAFLDDDAVAERSWIENLVDTYQRMDAIAVGGKILPIWLTEKPDYFPDELGWLLGLTHDGMVPNTATEVRNTFGPNMSFRREVFERIGLFNRNFGFSRSGTSCMQAEEAEFTLRMKRTLGKGVVYNSEAMVYHKVPGSKTRLGTMLRRAFYQGYSKALLQKSSLSPDSLATEKSYLKHLLFRYMPQRIRGSFSASGFVVETKKMSVLLATILSVGLGFMYGYMKRM